MQVGDFMGSHTPGMESSVLSACEAAAYIVQKL